ncbi:Prolyl oligopeptidase family protein [Quillaja saponaria]|uniref:Prolyl endopeptidase n=2 Tax=Fabales TaxID=72025 RepID=A0AAD7LBF4_QUISA|nr:Prolyl oligopeptidase family protein [Quillaja saponaria]
MDEILRPDKAWLHKLGTEQSTDLCLYQERDDMFSLDLHASQSKKYLFVASESKKYKTPSSVYDYDMKTGISVLKNINTVLGGFDASNYVTERKWAPASDGTQIPISIIYGKDLVKVYGSDPLLLYGYGSYEICLDPGFSSSRLSLLDRGFIYAMGHIRGGFEMGRQWPDLFKVAVAGVPFVDVVTAMLDPTIPLTTSEWEEWGDPRKEEFYFYMKSYSPVDNVRTLRVLLTNDYWCDLSSIWLVMDVVTLNACLNIWTDDNILVFKCELGAGHFSKSGRFEKLQEDAFTYAFIINKLYK